MQLNYIRWIIVVMMSSSIWSCAALRPVDTDVGYDGSLGALRSFVDSKILDWTLPHAFSDFTTLDGARIRVANWSPSNKVEYSGLVVFFSGRTEYIEKNIYSFTDMSNLGYEVWTLDWRGQGLSEKANPKMGDIDSFDTYVSDAHKFLEEIVQIGKHRYHTKILVSHSMGGTIATQYLQEHPNSFDYSILTSPMMGLGLDNVAVKSILHSRNPRFCANPFSFDCSWKSMIYANIDSCDFVGKADSRIFRDRWKIQFHSHDLNKLATQDCLIRASREPGENLYRLATGRPTTSWVLSAVSAMEGIKRNKGSINIPTLIVGGGADMVVSNSAQKEYCQSTSEYCCRVKIKNSYHDILIEKEEVRKRFFEYFNDFVNNATDIPLWCSQQ